MKDIKSKPKDVDVYKRQYQGSGQDRERDAGAVKIQIVNFIKLLLNFKINNDIINTANKICKEEVFIMPNIKPVSDLRNYTEVLLSLIHIYYLCKAHY